MKLDLHSIIDKFTKFDHQTMHVRINHFNGSVWYTDDIEDDLVHVRITDSYKMIRFYTQCGVHDVKLSYDTTKHELRLDVLEDGLATKNAPTDDLILSISISEFDKISSEEELFQRSVLEDLYGLTFDNVVQLRSVNEKLIEHAKSLLQEVK